MLASRARDHDRGALAREPERDGAAQSAPATRYDRDPVDELHARSVARWRRASPATRADLRWITEARGGANSACRGRPARRGEQRAQTGHLRTGMSRKG